MAVLALAAIGTWTIAVPYLGPAVGLELNVAARLEVVDHVLPGIVVVVTSGLMVALARRGASGGLLSLGAACVLALAGLWVTATHIPLLFDAGQPLVPWGAAIFHTASGPVVLALAIWVVTIEFRDREQA